MQLIMTKTTKLTKTTNTNKYKLSSKATKTRNVTDAMIATKTNKYKLSDLDHE